ncbi:MAG: hypothetical protein NW224_04205 [Leptolyngbyaceae cyanobacterium bins.302]|nr:hypothetical protein [Leptolyngbyaceae cyanobacterium bins.302]
MEISVACTLSQTDLSNRQKELNALQQAVCEVRQTSDGFALRFDGSTDNLMAIAHVIAKERLCCRFLQFSLIAEPGAGPLWLKVSGPNNTSQFLLEMFGFSETFSKLPTSSSCCSS